MQCFADGEMTAVWNKYYHYTSIVENEKQQVTADTPVDTVVKFDLQLGDWFWISPPPLQFVLAGDGIDIPHKPDDAKGAFDIVKIHVFTDENLQQSLIIGVPWLISGLSSYDRRIARVYQYASAKLGENGSLSFYSAKANCKICVNWYRYDAGDWPWSSIIVHRCFTHSGSFPFMYWIHHIGKAFVAVEKNDLKIFNAVRAGISEEHMPWNLNVQNIQPQDNFYCLATEKHWQVWANNVENYMANLANLANLTDKQRHNRRRRYAKSTMSPVLYKTPCNLVQYILDVMHDILRHAANQMMILVILLWCYYDFSMAEVVACIAHCCK